MAKKDLEKFADRTLMSWQRKLLDALHHTNDHEFMRKAEQINEQREKARVSRDIEHNRQAMALSNDMDHIKEKRDTLSKAVKVIINQAKMANVKVDREPLEREMAFARSLVNQLIDEITEQRKRLVKPPRPKNSDFEYEIWFTQRHVDHMRAALENYKPRGRLQKHRNDLLLRKLHFAEQLWKHDEEMDNE
jgi:hypothetical protein